MADIFDIPYDDVLIFFDENGIILSNDKENNYDIMWNLIKNNEDLYYTGNIIKWIKVGETRSNLEYRINSIF